MFLLKKNGRTREIFNRHEHSKCILLTKLAYVYASGRTL